MPKWDCNNCNRQLESELEPQKCPCGSENFEAKEQLSMLEKMMDKYLKNNSNRGKS